MRLHRLRMRAFGPFADDTVIDVDALAADGLFLLHGQTGAGKTTVLDAVAFALFGRVPGARNEAKRLHSDHAAPDVVPEVTLEATVGGRRLRITRSPDFHRPKKNGEGTRKINARATLEWVDGSGPSLTRIPEIGDAVIGALGMSAEQFFQVVLLPQGDFAQFLRAKPDERESLLERVFDTARFGDLEQWLRDRARESEASLDDRRAALDRLGGQIVAVGGGQAPAEPDQPWAQERLDTAVDDEHRLAMALTAAQAAADQARARHDHALEVGRLRRRADDARARLDQLARGEAEVSAAADALHAARRAAPLGRSADDVARAEAGMRRAEDACARAARAFVRLDDATALCASAAAPRATDAAAHASDAAAALDPAVLDAAIERWTAESGRWEPLARRVTERPAMVAELARADATVAAADRRITELTGSLDAAPARLAAASAALRAASETGALVPGLRAEHARVAALIVAWDDRERQRASVEEAHRALLDAREAHMNTREHLIDLRRRRLDGMAAELAAQLRDGDPCVVCGSTEHPVPTTAAADVRRVSEADEAHAQAAEAQTATRRDTAQSSYSALAQRLAVLDDTLGEVSRPELDADVARLATELAAAERAVEQIPESERAVAAVEAEMEAWRREMGERETARSACHERGVALRTAIDTLDAEVREATGDRGDVAARRAELADLCRRAASLRDARRESDVARQRYDDVSQRFASGCATADFTDVDAVRAALASAEQIDEWEAMLSRSAELRAAAQATLAEPGVAAAMSAEPVDAAAITADLDAAEGTRNALAREHAVAARRLADLKDYVAQYWSAADALAPIQARHEELRDLSELVAGRGQNSRRMSLRSYVLAARLEEVLVAASTRLRQMSSGRYEFAHTDAAGPRGRRGGLGIEVRDEYTGVTRATTTLSGGETFFASLALALGLADVVSAEAGGRVLDTIFIDEGFGTLDPEALDLVMGVLDDLRSGGRVIGVVSHVEELRARIPAQLHVRRGENGSKVRVEGVLGVS